MQLDVVVPAAAQTLVLARAPDEAVVYTLDDEPRVGGLEAGPYYAVFYARSPAELGVREGDLDAAHPSFPPPLEQLELEAEGPARTITELPQWLAELLRPPCPALLVSTVATTTTTLELFGAVDERRALARVGRALVTLDLAGTRTPATRAPLPRVVDAHNDGVNVWLFAGAEGQILAGRLDPDGALTTLGPPGWPPEAGELRHVSGARDPAGAPDVAAVTVEGWLLHFDGERWEVLFEPRAPVVPKEAQLVWLGPQRYAFEPGLVDGPALLEVDAGRVTELELPGLAAGEVVEALERGRDGALLVGTDEGSVLRVPVGERRGVRLGHVGAAVNALYDAEDALWTFGQPGLVRLSTSGRVCPAVAGSALGGRPSAAPLAAGVLFGDLDRVAAVR